MNRIVNNSGIDWTYKPLYSHLCLENTLVRRISGIFGLFLSYAVAKSFIESSDIFASRYKRILFTVETLATLYLFVKSVKLLGKSPEDIRREKFEGAKKYLEGLFTPPNYTILKQKFGNTLTADMVNKLYQTQIDNTKYDQFLDDFAGACRDSIEFIEMLNKENLDKLGFSYAMEAPREQRNEKNHYYKLLKIDQNPDLKKAVLEKPSTLKAPQSPLELEDIQNSAPEPKEVKRPKSTTLKATLPSVELEDTQESPAPESTDIKRPSTSDIRSPVGHQKIDASSSTNPEEQLVREYLQSYRDNEWGILEMQKRDAFKECNIEGSELFHQFIESDAQFLTFDEFIKRHGQEGLKFIKHEDTQDQITPQYNAYLLANRKSSLALSKEPAIHLLKPDEIERLEKSLVERDINKCLSKPPELTYAELKARHGLDNLKKHIFVGETKKDFGRFFLEELSKNTSYLNVRSWEDLTTKLQEDYNDELFWLDIQDFTVLKDKFRESLLNQCVTFEDFIESFDHTSISNGTLRKWVEKFAENQKLQKLIIRFIKRNFHFFITNYLYSTDYQETNKCCKLILEWTFLEKIQQVIKKGQKTYEEQCLKFLYKKVRELAPLWDFLYIEMSYIGADISNITRSQEKLLKSRERLTAGKSELQNDIDLEKTLADNKAILQEHLKHITTLLSGLENEVKLKCSPKVNFFDFCQSHFNLVTTAHMIHRELEIPDEPHSYAKKTKSKKLTKKHRRLNPANV
jgi:hypothetical protein